jgi:hypothetical protein
MHAGKLVFAQLMAHLPLHIFRQCVACYPSQYPTLKFSHLDQFLCMAFAQLTYRESLRDIKTCLRAHQAKLYHLDIRGNIAKSVWIIMSHITKYLIKWFFAVYLRIICTIPNSVNLTATC